MHNQRASVAALARNLLLGLDRSAQTTPVNTHSLVLLLSTLIEMVDHDNPIAAKQGAAQAAFVNSRIDGLEGRK